MGWSRASINSKAKKAAVQPLPKAGQKRFPISSDLRERTISISMMTASLLAEIRSPANLPNLRCPVARSLEKSNLLTVAKVAIKATTSRPANKPAVDGAEAVAPCANPSQSTKKVSGISDSNNQQPMKSDRSINSSRATISSLNRSTYSEEKETERQRNITAPRPLTDWGVLIDHQLGTTQPNLHQPMVHSMHTVLDDIQHHQITTY